MTATEATVLVVDDDESLADLIALWLRDEFRVRTAYSGTSALDRWDETVDLVFLDRQMPDITGDAVAAKLRRWDASCRIVFVSGVDPDRATPRAPHDDYLVKPVDGETVYGSARKFLGGASD